MDVHPGSRVRVRGLVWDVLSVDRSGDRESLSLRCVEGDMIDLEWDVHVPPDQVAEADTTFQTGSPAPLALWHLMHRAHILNQLPGGTSFLARQPGRIKVEPYQLVPLMRAMDMPRPRLLLADGVGLGKTVQAGLIAVELIARRRAHRILIVTPSGPLLRQWEQETRLRFGLKFTLASNAAELWEIRREHELGTNPFDAVALCLTSLDFAKQDHVLEELERSRWDLVIIDEAHHCVGPGTRMSRENTDRRRLAEVLARRSDGLLLLTATPHDGHDAHFASLIALLDPSLVDSAGGFVGLEYRRHVIRRMKAHIRDPYTGAPLFRRRHVVPVKVDVDGIEHETVRDFHRALSAFVVPRLRRRRGADDALAFVSLLKRSVSTIAACLQTLRVVLERLSCRDSEDIEPKSARRERVRALRAWQRRVARFGSLGAADEANYEALEIESMTQALRERPEDEPETLIHLGMAAEANDPKLSAMVLEVRLIRIKHERANILIYTEYADSQTAAARALRSAPGVDGEVLTIGGQDDDETRAVIAQQFAERDALILVSTDSLAEGLNLHRRCFHLIHLDLPYNPNRLEQRNGRIDRYGQHQEPEIRYLYIPGTFEESLLLRLIAKYEKARSSLDIMPDTLGATASPDDYLTPLTGNLSENRDDLFRTDPETIRTLDRSISDSSPETLGALLREIDRAFEAFDLMAVCHGWYGARGLNAGMDQVLQAERSRSHSGDAEDLAEFVGAVVAAETNQPTLAPSGIRLPPNWIHGIEDLPGFDPATSLLRFTHDFELYRDSAGQSTSFVGRAHPLVLRAIRHGCRLPGAVAVSRGKNLGLLLTFEIEIPVSNRAMFRQIVAVLARPDGPPKEMRQWLDLGRPEHTVPITQVWNRLFASWAGAAKSDSVSILSQIASRKHAAFRAEFDESRQEEAGRARRWLRMRADLLCGAFVSRTGDLFGGHAPGPVWRHEEDPLTRLILFAADPETPGPKRRDANETVETFHQINPSEAAPGPVASRQIGMLMLVPADAL